MAQRDSRGHQRNQNFLEGVNVTFAYLTTGGPEFYTSDLFLADFSIVWRYVAEFSLQGYLFVADLCTGWLIVAQYNLLVAELSVLGNLF